METEQEQRVLPVTILVIDNEYGINVTAWATETRARQYLAEYVAEWWEQEINGEEMPDDPEVAIAEYFDGRVPGEGYVIETDVAIGS